MTESAKMNANCTSAVLRAAMAFGCFLGIMYLLMFENALFISSLSWEGPAPLFHECAYVSALLCAAIGARVLAVRRDNNKPPTQWFPCIICAAMLLAAWGIDALTLALPSLSIMGGCLCWLLLGASAPPLLYSGIKPFEEIPNRLVPVALGAAALLGSVVYYSCNVMGSHGALLLLSTLSFAGAALASLPLPVPADKGGVAACRSKLRYPLQFKIALVLYAMTFGMMAPQTFRFYDPYWTAISTIALALPALAAVLVALRWGNVVETIRDGKLQRVIAALVIAGFLPLAIFGPAAIEPCCTLIVCAFSLFSIVDFSSRVMMRASCVEESRILAMHHQSYTMGGIGLGFLLGWLVPFENGNPNLVAGICLTMTLVLIILVAVIPPPDVLMPKDEDEEAPRGRPWEDACSVVAKDHGLTPRETEILLLLSKRASTKMIQDKLVISPHTVESHVHNIYRKLGVNSRDEVVALVEAAR